MRNSKEIVNLQGVFVLTISKVSITILLKGNFLFKGCLYYLSVHFHSCCFYIQYHGGIREITSMTV